MTTSVFDIFKVGLGPSSSHTVGPMKIAYQFLEDFQKNNKDYKISDITQIKVILYGSLALTGKGHRTDDAVLLGLSGILPQSADPKEVLNILATIKQDKKILLNGKHPINFDPKVDIIFNFKKRLEFHSNGMELLVHIASNDAFSFKKTYYSIGGGQILDDEDKNARPSSSSISLPYPYNSASFLLEMGKKDTIRLDQMILKNELTFTTQEEIEKKLFYIWDTMQECALNGIQESGTLPGPLKIVRRANGIWNNINQKKSPFPIKDNLTDLAPDFTTAMDWVTLWAMAINEENAAGNRVVTAPTNGGAGTLPSVLHYYHYFIKNSDKNGILRFLLVSGGIGILYQKNASISAAEVGCQGEIGVACSMAAGGLASALGASNEVIENAAEIGMEHNLGLTCDPVGGLVQIPCIERNVMGAIKAISATRLAMQGNGEHKISLDKVIKTMLATGHDMQERYKETSLGGLAVNVPEC